MFLPREWIPSFSIEPTHRLSLPVADSFLEAVQTWIGVLIQENVQREEDLFQWLKRELPIIDSFPADLREEDSMAIPITTLYPAQFASNLERYVVDAVTRRLLPGTCMSIVGQASLQFSFAQNPKELFFFHKIWVGVRDAREKQEILENLKPFFREMKLNMDAVCQGRSFQISRGVHPTFMPRNEEELLRNLVLLSKEVQYVKDLPQVSIHYERQSDHHLIFIVLLVRLRIGSLPCVHQLFSDQTLRCEVDDVRMLGQLRGKYPKEAAILHIYLEKGPFFRPDFSIDLLRARQRVSAELTSAMGEFRDFNGGMILKQEESLCELRKRLYHDRPEFCDLEGHHSSPSLNDLSSAVLRQYSSPHDRSNLDYSEALQNHRTQADRGIAPLSQAHEFLLENYFYSLRPVIAQTVYDPGVLKAHFELLAHHTEIDLKGVPYRLLRTIDGDYELYFLFAIQLDTRKLVRELKKEPYRSVTAVLSLDRMTALGWIVRNDLVDWEGKIERLLFYTESGSRIGK